MFRDQAIEVAPTWAQDDQTGTSYREIDKQLRRIAKKQAALDAEQAKWLREAERHRIWRKLGFSTRAVRELAKPTDAGIAPSSRAARPNGSSTRSRFENVVMVEHAKQALMQLGFKARAARSALQEVCAHVGAGADVASLVKAVLDGERDAKPEPATSEDMHRDAANAIAGLGYTRAIATAAVAAASAHVGADTELATLIKEALRRC
jgi:hypothetical protein